VTNSSQWLPDTYTITFGTGGQYTVTNSGGTTVTSGTYTDGGSVSFNGIQVPLSGTPNATDTFTVSPAGKSSVFATLNSLITTLSSPGLSRAQIATQIGTGLEQIDAAVSNLGNVSASVGARLNSITSAQTTAKTVQTTLQGQISNLSNVDYTAAVTQLSTEELALQAAQASYASIAKLSLFNYLH